jgi:DNA polymerase III epsilon subunit-like protein
MERFVAIDVEIASKSPLSICAIGAARFEFGRETGAYRSLVHVDGPVRFSQIHGLTRADLLGAPPWPVAWKGILSVLDDISTLVAFRASFDRGAILAMSAHHKIRLPRLRFVCAAAMMEERYGSRLDLSAYLGVLGVPFPGRPHEPLSDARAAALIAMACGAARNPAAQP